MPDRRTTHPARLLDRRSFLKRGGALAGAHLLAGLPAAAPARALEANGLVRLGWIGAGGRGSALLERALNSVSVSKLAVAAICDIHEGRRRAAVERCGGMRPAAIHDYRELLERPDVDAVFIATPIHLHAEHAIAAVEAGKHVYCEKPLGRTPHEVKGVHEAVKRSGRKFQVGFQWRYHSGFQALVETVQTGRVGKVSFVTAERHVGGYPESGWYVDRDLSGDLIVEQAVHEMNVFCWMLESHPLRAAGFGGINALAGRPPGRTIMDAYSVVFEFPRDIRLSYSHCVYAPGGFDRLHQTVYGGNHQACTLEGTVNLFVSEGGERRKVDLPPFEDATELAIQSFIRSLREDREPLADVDAGRRATLMAILGRTAIHERRVVEWREVDVEARSA